jgi:hypothetical protein
MGSSIVSMTNLGFQGVFSTRLGIELSFCLFSISHFHIATMHQFELYVFLTTTTLDPL